MPNTQWTAPAQIDPTGSVAGTTVNTAATVDATPGPDPYIIPPFTARGQKLRIRAFGDYSTSATGANITWGVYHGSPSVAIGSAVVLAASAATASVSTSSVLWPWMLELEGTIRTLGTTGSIYVQGRLWTPTSLTAGAMQFMPITSALRLVSTIDTTTFKQLMLGITLSGTTGSPALTCQHFDPELIG